MGKRNSEEQEELNLEEDGDGSDEKETEEGEGEGEGDEDRGDDLHPEDKDVAGLKAVAGDEDEDEEQDGKPAGSKFVPHARFNEVNTQLKTERETRLRLEEENARLKGASAASGKGAQQQADDDQAPVVDLKTLRKARNAALMEGDEDKALELDEQIDGELKRQAEAAAEARAVERENEREQAAVQREFKATATELLKQYPMLNAGTQEAPNADANVDAIEDVVVIRDRNIRSGDTPAVALRKAVERAAKIHGLQAVGEDGDDEADGKVAQNVTQIDKLRQRRQQSVERNAAASKSQPAALGTSGAGVGARSSKGGDLDVETMSEEDFEKLPAAEKKRMRGD